MTWPQPRAGREESFGLLLPVIKRRQAKAVILSVYETRRDSKYQTRQSTRSGRFVHAIAQNAGLANCLFEASTDSSQGE
jgi:hypothetical protein